MFTAPALSHTARFSDVKLRRARKPCISLLFETVPNRQRFVDLKPVGPRCGKHGSCTAQAGDGTPGLMFSSKQEPSSKKAAGTGMSCEGFDEEGGHFDVCAASKA